MNLPGDKIHDTHYSYGHLLIPWFGQDRWGNRRWIAYFSDYFVENRVKTTGYNGFHNCRITGVN